MGWMEWKTLEERMAARRRKDSTQMKVEGRLGSRGSTKEGRRTE